MKRFFSNQEREISFEIRTQADGWAPIEKATLTVKGIASLGGAGLEPGLSQPSSGTIRLFFRETDKSVLEGVTTGSIVTVDGSSYQISKVDLRGTLPGSYPLRLEGVKK